MMAGTPAFLAPEVARGQMPTTASDVFSLGATLFAAIEGRGPFGDGENQLALLHAVAAGNVRPPEHAGSLTPTLMSLLANDPEARPDMRRASMELGAALATRPIEISSATLADSSAASGAGASSSSAPSRVPPPAAPQPPPNFRQQAPPAPRPTAHQPAVSGPPPPGPPRPQTRTTSAEDRRKLAVLVGAIVAVVALAGLGVVLVATSQGTPTSPGGQAAGRGSPGIPSVTATTTSAAPAPPPPPPSPQTQPAGSEGQIEWSSAGQLVINYYNGLSDPSSAWQMLSPGAQGTFGSEQQFQQYWSKFSSVSARNAHGVRENGDGTVTVPVDVSYDSDSGNQAQKRQVRVAKLNGRLLIDSDPR
jgi:serine/threonine protein kinase